MFWVQRRVSGMVKSLLHLRSFRWIGVTVLTLALGGLAGKLVSAMVVSHQEQAENQRRAEMRNEIMRGMQLLTIGDTLADHEFDDLSGQSFRLSSLTRGGGRLSRSSARGAEPVKMKSLV